MYRSRCAAVISSSRTPRTGDPFPRINDGIHPGQQKGNLHAGWRFGLFTGLRLDNILNLTDGHVDLNVSPATITFPDSEMKNDEEHVIRLCRDAEAIVRERVSSSYPNDPTHQLFHGFTSTWKRIVARLKKEKQIRDITFHDLRRTFGTFRMLAGIHPAFVQDGCHH